MKYLDIVFYKIDYLGLISIPAPISSKIGCRHVNSTKAVRQKAEDDF